jgi:hypothetical protein
MCFKELICLLALWQHLPHLGTLSSLPDLVVFCTALSGGCAVFASLLQGADALCVGASFLSMCLKEPVCFLAHMAIPSPFALSSLHDLVVFCVHPCAAL